MISFSYSGNKKSSDKIIIELGCGASKIPGAIGIDKFVFSGVNLVADIEKGLPFLKTNSVDQIYSRHFLEHIQNFEYLMREIHRVLKPNGKHIVIIPHFSNPHYYSDYTHKRFFGIYSFDYFTTPEFQLRRKVPSFYVDFYFRIIKRELRFKSNLTWLNLFKKVFQKLINHSSSFQEFYEENLVYLFPCQEIYFEMIPIK